MKTKLLLNVIPVIIILLLSSCVSDVQFPSIDYISISPDGIDNVQYGTTQQFIAMAHGDKNPPNSVLWSVTGNNSPNTSIDSKGMLTVSHLETSKSLVIQASSLYDKSKNTSVNVGLVENEQDIIGAIISFGAYQWRVLDKQDNKLLLISEKIVERRSYHNYSVDITWEESHLRSYLNSVFYDSFSEDNKDRIIEVNNSNENNQWYDTEGGSDTVDKIFLLSIAEVVKYFGDSGLLENRPPFASEINDQFNSNRQAFFSNMEITWWLRSPGGYKYNTSAVLENGSIDVYGRSMIYNFYGVRPALWISL